MDEDIKELYDAALSVMKNAYAPYSDHPVAAAIRADDGRVFTGVNVEAAHFLAIHAEGTAISDMVKNGAQKIKDVAVVGPGDLPCTPCGDCRQRIREFADKNTNIYVFHRNGALLKSYTLDDLLPDSFGPENLDK